ncbi:MAG: hypothetical protein EA349_05115 [Halomonadaceae bacterium]|nr:MAG: hypothetical protein EA349_05115 [Halomonadaceae bacterium]
MLEGVAEKAVSRIKPGTVEKRVSLGQEAARNVSPRGASSCSLVADVLPEITWLATRKRG